VTGGIPVTHSITVTQGANGAIACDKTAVDHGANASCTIAPSAGYYVTDVTVDGSSVGAVTAYSFNNVTSAHTITAVFGLKGDIDQNGSVDLRDAISALQIASGWDMSGKTIMAGADVNGDGKIGLADVIFILQRAAGIR
jgi:hypothetical protein